MASASSSFWPTYMNPANGAIFPPTTTYTPTYMDPNNGAIYPSVTITTSVYTTRASSRTGSGMGITAVGAAYSSLASSSEDVMLSDMQASSVSMSTSTLPDTDSASSTSTSDSDSQEGGAPSPLKVSVAAVPAVIGTILVVLGIWLCCRCKKRRRARKERGVGPYGDMSEVGGRAGRTAPLASTTSLSRSRLGFEAASAGGPPSLTRDEARGIVSARSHWVQPDHRIDLISSYPSRPQPAAAGGRSSSSLGPPPLSAYYQHHPTSPAGTFGRVDSRAGSSSRHSRWTDDTEYDVMAEDGSTITRTLSTTSTRRTVGADEPFPLPSSRGGAAEPGSGSGLVENPFDHPAYTYRAAPQRSTTALLSRGNTLNSGTWSSTHTHTHTQPPSLAYNSTLSLNSPVTPIAPTQSTHLEADTYSIHSSDDGIFGGPGAGAASARARPGMRREPTIIRHADSSVAGPGRWSTTVERAGRDDAGVVELPPLYEDATSGWTR